MAIVKLTGYQWGLNKRFIGPYEFEHNTDFENIHLPHNTTLTPPPEEMAAGHFPAWNAVTQSWDEVADLDEAHMIVRSGDEVPQ